MPSDSGTVQESVGDRDLSTIEKLREGQVMIGAVRHEYYATSQRRMVSYISQQRKVLNTDLRNRSHFSGTNQEICGRKT
jgi:hypothetical protein